MLMYSETPISVKQLTPFARGDHRLCFQHPENDRLCVKINREGKAKALKEDAPFYKKFRSERSFDDNWREYQAFQQPAIVNNTPHVWKHIPRCYGWVTTDLGPGLVTDYYATADGLPAQTLENYLQQNGLTTAIQSALDAFASFLRETLLLTKNLLPHNLLVVEDQPAPRIVLIDGFGLASALPLAKHSRYFARKHVEKRLHRMKIRIAWELSDKNQTWLEVEKQQRNTF